MWLSALVTKNNEKTKLKPVTNDRAHNIALIMKMYIAFRLSSFLFFILAIIFVGTRHHCCCPHCLNVVHTERNTLIYTSSFHDHLTVQFITADLSIAVHLAE